MSRKATRYSKKPNNNNRSSRRNKNSKQQSHIDTLQDHVIERNTEKIRALTEAQSHYMMSISSNDIVFAIGDAGTGKTFVAAVMAIDALLDGDVRQIVLTRPAMEAGESLGFLKGDKDEKYEPYMAPFRRILNERIGKNYVDALIKSHKIIPYPLAYMRGEAFDNSWILLDEAQNVTREQMKMFLTRMGKHSKMIISGDPDQSDSKSIDGLLHAVKTVENIAGVSVTEFEADDCVRSDIVTDILKAYSSRD